MLLPRVLILALLLTLLSCSSEPAPASPPDMLDVIETRLELPPGARPLEDYSRYYCRSSDKVVGVYVLPNGSNHRRGRNWVSEAQMPFIADGGCSVVRVIFDLPTLTLESVLCSGVA